MKDILIPVKLQKSELIWFAVSFCAAFLINIVSIIMYATSWSEVYTQILWVILIACVLYAVSVALRFLIYMVKRLF